MKKSSSILVKNNIDKNSIDSIAIGGFDGMHIAHQELFKNLNPKGAIISIETGYASITPKNYRQEYTKYPIFYYDLEDIKALDGADFIEMSKIFFKSCVLYALFLLNGDIEKANSFLGKEYKIFGKHIVGQGLGKKEFVATINLNVNDFLLPQSGVYITKTIVNDIEYNSVSFLGHRGSTDGKFAVETHILNQENIEIKDENVQIKFIRRIRENRKFDNFLELKNQILKDIDIAKNIFINF